MVRPDDIDDYHYGTGDMDVQSIHENAMHEVRMRGVSNNRIQARRELFETMLFSELSEDQRKKMQEEPFNKYKSIKVSFSLHALSHRKKKLTENSNIFKHLQQQLTRSRPNSQSESIDERSALESEGGLGGKNLEDMDIEEKRRRASLSSRMAVSSLGNPLQDRRRSRKSISKNPSQSET